MRARCQQTGVPRNGQAERVSCGTVLALKASARRYKQIWPTPNVLFAQIKADCYAASDSRVPDPRSPISSASGR
ncbi:hypothetical protein [Polaromonas sp.]|uniref:hypothetical protein n=1 Tax=Polaromonas sp. TaxID=1869339 RepID=UPI001795C016|nr:hypothetical protein [Polaromonas sp.]NML84551.1 hypothetical protein [Polaromonas sp.]